MGLWDAVATGLGTVGGGLLGTVFGGPIGGAVGAGLGNKLADYLTGDDEVETTTAGGGLQFGGGSSGGGGAGVSFPTPNLPAMPTAPSGGLQGPVYSNQGLPAQAAQALSTVLSALRAYPMISDFVQRHWNFPKKQQETNPQSQALWTALAKQVPKSHREALEQFLVGFPAPVGLSKSASDVFMTLMIAEAGYSPEQIGCCSEGRK